MPRGRKTTVKESLAKVKREGGDPDGKEAKREEKEEVAKAEGASGLEPEADVDPTPSPRKRGRRRILIEL